MRFLFLLLSFALIPLVASPKPLMADLSQYRIEIDSSFTGTRLLLFGARNDTGDVVVAVRGPRQNVTVRRKERVAGIWMNRNRRTFENVPTYYAIAASRPLSEMPYLANFPSLELGLKETVTRKTDPIDLAFAAALIRQEQGQLLYSPEPQKVSFMGEALFKVSVPFPDTIPGGDYSADVYLFTDGKLSSMQSIPIHVAKTGFDAWVYDLSHTHPFLYGVTAVLVALGMGWGASTLMQRV